MMANTKSSPHSKETRFVCKSCSRTFRRVEHLRRHETSHTGTRPHVCPKCKATFFRGDVLVRHMRNVHKTMISGVKELRSSAQILMEPDGLSASSAAGTSASIGVPQLSPNPYDHQAAVGASPSGPYGQHWVQLQYHSPQVQAHSSYGISPGVGVPAGVQHHATSHPNPYASYASQQHLARHPLHGGSSSMQPNPLLGQANPPIQNLIAYGYGPYTPSIPGWTDTAPPASSAAVAAAGPGELSSDIAGEGPVLGQVTSRNSSEYSPRNNLALGGVKKRPRTSDMMSVDAGSESLTASNSRESLASIGPKGKDVGVSSETLEERAQYSDFIPTHDASSATDEFQPYPDLYSSDSDLRKHRPSTDSSASGHYSFDTHLKSVLHVSYPPRQPLSEASFSSDAQASLNISSEAKKSSHAASGAGSGARSGTGGDTGGAFNSTNQSSSIPKHSAPNSIHGNNFMNSPGMGANTTGTSTSSSTGLSRSTSSQTPYEDGEPSGAESAKITAQTKELRSLKQASDGPEVCPACGVAFKSVQGDTHDYSFMLLDSASEFSHVTGLLVGPPKFVSPSVMQLDRYLSYYASFAHPTLPVIHLSTFDPKTAKPALLFSVCSLGASMLQENTMARMLHFNADRLLAQDWKAFLASGKKTMDIETWLSFMQTSIYIEWQSFAMASSPNVINVGFAMRDLQTKLFKWLPAIQFHTDDASQSRNTWIQEQRVLRSFATILSLEFILVSCYNYESHCHHILEICKDLALPGSELLWNTSFSTEDSWRQHLSHEILSNKKSVNPRTFGELLTDLKKFDFASLKQKASQWQLFPVCIILFVTFACNEFEARNMRMDDHSEVLELLWTLLRDPTPSVGQCAVLSPLFEPSHRAFRFLRNQNSFNLQIVPACELIWQNQHPLVALGCIVLESAQCGLFVGVTEIKENVRKFNSAEVSDDLLNAMIQNQNKDMSQLLPAVTLIIDFVRFGLILGQNGMTRFNRLYSQSTLRTFGVLVCHRTLSFFSCWVFATELKVRTGQKVNSTDRKVLNFAEKVCRDYNITGVEPLPAQTVEQNDDSVAKKDLGTNADGNSSYSGARPARLTVTAGIVKLLGNFCKDMAESIPGEPFYKALMSIGMHLENNSIAPTGN